MTKTLTCNEQAESLMAAVPLSYFRHYGSSRFVWSGNVSPEAFSPNYFLKIDYTIGGFPETHVLAPSLTRYKDESLPHVYPGEALCLFDPRSRPREWDASMRISETILPWAVMWLYYYEIWAITGVWHGGGHHTGNKEAAA